MRNTTIGKSLNVGKHLGRWRLGYLVLVALMSVTTAFSQTGTIAIGSGTSTSGVMPINSCYNYSYSQQIVKASDYAIGGGVAGQITKIRFYYTGGDANQSVWNNWTVYIGHTAKTAFTSNTDWEPVANLTQVYSGVLTPAVNSWVEITLSTPFAYNGTSNLIVAVDENVDNYSCTANWGSYDSSANTGIYYYSDGTNPNPASPPTGTRTTSINRLQFVGPLASCIAPTGVTSVATGVATGTVSWTASSTVPANGYEYYYSTTNTAPTGSTTASGSVAAGVTTAFLSGLAANTQYYVWVRSKCSGSDSSVWSLSATFTTLCSATDLPYSENANSATPPAMPACITTQNAGNGNNWATAASPGAYGFNSKVFRYSYNSANAANAWFFTQGLNLTGGVSYRVSYKYGNNSTTYTEKLKVAYGSNNTAAAMVNVLATHNSITGASGVTTFVDFTPAATGVYYIGFNAFSAADQDQLYVDNISVILTPSCEPVTGVTAAATGAATGNVSWTASTSAPANGYQYYYSTTNTAPTASTTPSGSVAAGVTTAALSGLTSNTLYNVWVRSVCGAADMSAWSSSATFTTLCSATDVPYTENANSAVTPAMPACITTQNAGTGNNWTTAGNPGDYGFSSQVFRYQYNSANPANAWFFTQGVNLTGGVSYRLSYKYGNNSTFYVEKLKVAYGTMNSAAGMTNVLVDHTNVTGASATTNVIDFTPATTGVYYVGFNAHSIADQFSLYVDDISLTVTPTCEPVSGVAATTVSFTSGNLVWNASTSNPANGYEYYVSTTNTAPGASVTPTGATAAGVTQADLTGLTASTTYYVWVRAVCSPTDPSPWAGGVSFFTGYCTPAPSSVDNNGITNVTFGTINNTTGAEPGNYSNYSAMSTNVDVASTVSFSITYQTGYTYGTKIWVDWNNDTDFTDAGELVYTGLSTNANPTTLTGSFQVPADAAVVGSHRIRIGGTDNDSGGTPCYTGAYGTYEDYTINVVIPPAPVVTGFTPDTYCAVEGVITINGTNLANATLTIGGTPVDIATNTTTQITATVPAGVSGTVMVSTFGGSFTTTNNFMVSTPAALTLSGTSTTICSGATTAVVNVTAGLADFDTFVWSPSTGVSGTAASGYIFTATETTTYTLTASQSAGSCQIAAEYTVNVNPVPNAVTINPSTANACQGSLVTLSATGGEMITDITYCTPTVGNTGATGDYINNFTFANITNNASGDAASDYTYYSGMTANVVGGQTYNISLQGGSATWGQTFRVWIDFNHDGVFSATESVFSTATASTAVQTGTITIPATAFNGLTRMRVGDKYNSATTAAEACGHTGFGEWEDYNVMITGATNPVDYVWSPVSGLYTDAAGTTPYTGAPATMVFAMPMATTTYTATVTSDLGCTTAGTAVINVSVVPAPTGNASQDFTTAATVAQLTATGSNIQWYNVATGGNALAPGTGLTSGTYYATQTINGCESQERFAVTVTIPQMDWVNLQWPPQLTITQGTTGIVYAQAYEPGVTPGAGPGIGVQAWVGISSDNTNPSTWTTWVPATFNVQVGNNDEFMAAIGENLAPGTYYYASRFQLMEGPYSYGGYNAGGGSFWDGQEYVSGVLTVNCGTEAPTAAAAQSVCFSGTIADLAATGQDVQWYATATGGTPLASTMALQNGATYYASQTTTCESITRTAVTVTINTTAAPAGAAAQVFEDGATVADLMATGTDIMWYDAQTGGMMLDADTELVNGATYYATQTMNGCESMAMLAVTVTVNAPVMDWVNLQWPGNATITQGSSVDVYAQGYEAGVTPGAGQGAGVQAWIGISMDNSNPDTWTTWVPATFNTQSGNNDEFMASIGASLAPGTYYYASRFQLQDGPYSYGGFGGNGFWDGTASVSGILTVECAAMAPVAEAMQYICVSGTVADLQAEGQTIMWYADMDGGQPLASDTVLESGMTYYASQMTGGCESARTAVMVEVTTTAAPAGETSQTVYYSGNEPTVDDIDVTGENITWYPTMEDAMAGTNALAPGTVVEVGMTYYAMQTVNGCTSVDALAVTVAEVLAGDKFDLSSFSYYPNPVRDVLNITYSSDITSVTVFNMLGQQVMAAKPNATNAKLDMSVLSDGTYLVNVSAGNAVKTIKVVKKQ